MESRSSGIEQISEERDGFSASGPGIADSGDTNADVDVHSASGLPSSSDHGPSIGDSGDTNVDVHSASGIPPSSDQEPGIGDSGDTNVDVRSASVLHQSSEKEPAIGDSGDINADAHSASGLPSSSDHDPSIGDSDVHSASGIPSSDHEPSIGDSGDTKADVNSASGLHSSSDPEPRIGDSDVTNADTHSLSGLLYSDLEPTIADSGDTKADVNSASGFHSSSDHEPRIDDSDVTNEDKHSLSGLLYSDLEPTIADSGDTKADVNSASGFHSSSDPEPRIGDSDVTNADSPSLSGLLYSDHEPTIADSGDTKADVNFAAGLHSSSDPEPRIGDSDVTNADSPSLSGLLYSDHEPRIGDSDVTNADSPSLSGLLYSDHEPTIADSGDTKADVNSASGFHSSSDPEPRIGDSDVTNADSPSLSGLLYSDHEPRIGDSDVTNADSPSLSGLLYSDQEPTIADSGDTNADVVVDIHMKSGSAEFPETLKEQLYIKNLEKELVHLQLCEERNLRKEFEQHHLQWANEKSSFTASIDDLEGKNKTLSEELAKCRSELDIVSDKIEGLEMSVSFSKTELDWSSSRIQELQIELSNVSSELVESKSLVSDLQSKNETLNANVASFTNEKEGLVSENEKLIKELKECKSLLELSQVDNVNVQESLALVMEERAKLEEARQIYESEKEKLQSDWKKLDAVLSSEREERNKHKEANEHFIQENNKVSMELLESKKSMESLHSEIANLNENLDLVTKERSKLGEDMNHLRSEKEECLIELTNCKTLLKNLEVEYEKSMKESRDNTLKLEQLTQENLTLSSFEETFLKNVILDEFMKQYVSTVESKKGELVILCEDLIQEAIITKKTNSDLTEKLHNSESRIQDLQEQLEDTHRAHNLLSDSYKDMTEKTNSDLTEKLQNSESRIQDLQEQLEDARRDHNLLSESYKEMTEKTKDLESTNELAAYVIHKVFDNLQKLVNNSDPTTESVHDDLRSGQVDHLEISNYDVFIERLIMILYERSQLEIKNREYNLELLRRIKDLEGSNKRFNYLDFALLEERLKSKELQINQLTSSIASYELESFILKESLRTSMQQIVVIQSETKIKETELHQSENRVSALREKLHIAVTKGKGLIQQRDALKQNLTIKDSAIQELETKLKSYSEAGERMEALESELSYIRNSATALRESFLLKDSVLQRIEEILEDLDLPEHFHDRDIIDKIDWLAKSVSHGPIQTGIIERAHSYPGSGPIDGWKEDLEPVSDELRRNYEELQNKFYELAEQNEMLEQSLMERNNVVQRFEEVLEKTNMPLQLRSLEPEDKIDWLRVALAEASDRCALLEQSLMERNNVVQRCEEVLEKTDMPLDMRSLELEEKIGWLHFVLAEANDRCALLEKSLMERNNVVQRCEEVLEKTDMPLDMRSLELGEKIGWLHFVLAEANDRCALLEKSLMERNNVVQRCEEVLEKTDMPLDMRSLELGEKIGWLHFVLAEANDRCALLEKSLMERNNVVQRCEEVLEKTNMPLDLRSLELEERIDWLRVALVEAVDGGALLEQSLMERNRVVQRCEEVLEKTNLPPHVRLLEPEAKIDWLSVALGEANDRCALLHERHNLMQRCEEVLEKTNMPPHLQSLEPEAKIDWLRVALAEANDRCALLQQDLENARGSLSADLEESNGRLLDLQANLKSITDEKEQILARFEAQSQDYNKIFEKVSRYEIENEKLQNEIDALQSKLAEKNVDEEHIHHVHGEIKRLQDLVKNMLQDSEMEDLDSSMNDIECLERLLRKLEERYPKYPSGERSIGQLQILESKLEQVEGDLMQVKEERDKHMEKSQSLVNEVEALVVKNQEVEGDLVQVKEERDKHMEKSQSLVNEVEALVVKNQEVESDLVQVKEERDKHMEKSQSLVNEVEALVVKNQEVEGDLVQMKEERDKHMEKSQSLVNEVEALVVKNQEVESNLVQVKEERDKHMEKSQSLVNEVEALVVKNEELQKLLVQEEQKCGVVREKLNVAVRKGKSLVQQRDAMKQTINELTAEVARLTSEIKVRENTLLAHQEKMKDLFTLQELVDNKDSEIGFLKNRLEEILRVLGEIDVGVELKSNDPIEKIQQIEKTFRDLQDGILSAEQDSRKSKRAAELLLEELNEVQERNEDLLEEISKVSNEKKIAEAATRDSLSHLEQLSAVHLEERNIQFEELMKLKSGLEQLRPELSKIFNLVDDVLPKDLDHLYNLDSGVKSLLESSDASNSSHGGVISRKDSKENLHSRLFLDTKREEEHSDNEINDLWRFIGTHIHDLITNINLFEEKLQAHSKSLHKEAINLSETVSSLHKEMTSNKYSLESINKQKETEILALHKHVSILYEACKNSVYEIEKIKGQLDSNDDMESSLFIEGETLSVSEERIMSIVNRLSSLVKDVHSFQTENIEVNQKEMKATISSLQKELTEKDVQKDRMCVDLVSQIKRAETAAMNNLQELESAKVQINDMKGQLEAVNLECNALKQRVKEVEEDKDSILVDLQEKVKSLTQALTAKEQEAEALLQALDEEEAQMEDLTNKITELEKQIQQKNLDLVNTESARGKALKKLSITVKKFDELHHLSETLVSEIDHLQSQIQERDSEISFLRDEITRCTSDSLQALETDKKNFDGIQDILTFLESQDLNLEDNNGDQVLEFKEVLKKQITSIISELKELRQVAQSKDDLLQRERIKVEDLNQKRELLESSLREQESRLSLHQENNDSVHTTSMTSEIVEVEPVINNWQPKGASMAPQVRSLRKVNNDQLAISIDDIDSDEKDKLEDEDDDKAHGFKSLTTSKLVPKFTRPVTNFVDGLWVSCDRALQRQPVLRLNFGSDLWKKPRLVHLQYNLGQAKHKWL
ncbi:hypothetical protein L1887_27648 [Cichorium endivia]|nr:hypothetical protein L1887_27648 [Cichorium endivia]